MTAFGTSPQAHHSDHWHGVVGAVAWPSYTRADLRRNAIGDGPDAAHCVRYEGHSDHAAFPSEASLAYDLDVVIGVGDKIKRLISRQVSDQFCRSMVAARRD